MLVGPERPSGRVASSARSGRSRGATLSDVARLARVSPTTVSYVANGRGEQMRISVETAARVCVAMEQLGYRPNRAAQALRTATTASIGLITDFVAGGEFSARMLLGATQEARARDHVLLIIETGADAAAESDALAELLARGVDGVLYATRAHVGIEPTPALRTAGAVLLNCADLTTPGLPCVVPDDEGGGWLAADLLVRAGLGAEVHMVGEAGVPELLAEPLRRRGVERRLAEAGSRLTGVVPCRWDVQAAFAAVDTWLSDGARPRALICLNDRAAMGACQALQRHGARVPEDVSVVSFDGSELASWLRPAVTSVALPFEEMGRRAIRRLIDGLTLGVDQAGWRDVLATTVLPGASVRSG